MLRPGLLCAPLRLPLGRIARQTAYSDCNEDHEHCGGCDEHQLLPEQSADLLAHAPSRSVGIAGVCTGSGYAFRSVFAQAQTPSAVIQQCGCKWSANKEAKRETKGPNTCGPQPKPQRGASDAYGSKPTRPRRSIPEGPAHFTGNRDGEPGAQTGRTRKARLPPRQRPQPSHKPTHATSQQTPRNEKGKQRTKQKQKQRRIR